MGDIGFQAVRILSRLWRPIYFLLVKILGFHYVFILMPFGLLEEKYNGTTFKILTYPIFFIIFLFWLRGRITEIIRIFKKDFKFPSLIDLTQNKKYTFKKLDKEVTQAKEGVFLGRIKDKNIIKPQTEDGHILVVGGQGSGKTTSIAIPTLLTWTAPIFAIDIKGELSGLTKNNRKNMKIFDPMDFNTFTYDPYSIFKSNVNRVQSAREIAISILPVPEDVRDPFWKQSAQNLLTASILHFENLGFDFPGTMKKVMSLPPTRLIEELKNSQDTNAPLFANQFIDIDIKTLGGIFTELSNNILLFATDDNIIKSLERTSKNISIDDLENGKDIFLRFQEDKLEQWKQVINLIVSQFLRGFERRLDNNDKPILFLLDEFPRLGKIEGITNGLSTLRSKKIHILLIIQSLAQLDDIYSKEKRKIIADNCRYKAVLNAFDSDTQDYFSRLVGTYDMDKFSSSQNYGIEGVSRGSGTSKTIEERKIIKPEEFAYLSDTLVLFTPKGFETPKKVPYFLDKNFTNIIKSGVEIS